MLPPCPAAGASGGSCYGKVKRKFHPARDILSEDAEQGFTLQGPGFSNLYLGACLKGWR